MTTLVQLMPSAAPLSSHFHDSVEAERQRIARDLHDSIGGMLSTALLLFDSVEAQNSERFQRVKSLLQDTQREVRRIAHNMSPVALTKLGIVAALEQYSEEINTANEVYVDLHVLDRNFFKSIDKSLQINAYRMVQELLQNAIKHSSATRIELLVHHSDKNLLLMYEDNGCGNDALNHNPRALRSLRERVKLNNGKVRIKSLENQGTIVKIEVPLR